MIIAAIYPVLLWLLVFRLRRTVLGAVVLAGGTVVLWPLANLVTRIGFGGAGGGGMLVAKLMWAEMFLVVLIGVALWLVRRPPEHPYCAYCHYDLSGIDTSAGQVPCPECGECLSQGLRLAGGAVPPKDKIGKDKIGKVSDAAPSGGALPALAAKEPQQEA